MDWYIVQAQTNRENAVKTKIMERAEKSGITDQFGEILVPEEDVVSQVRGKKKVSKKRFYPGYVFVEMEFNEVSWHLVKSTPFVAGFVGGGVRPSPISKAEVAKVKERILKSEQEPVFNIEFKVGDTVRFKEGSFKDFNGVVANIDVEKVKVKVNVTVFGRETGVEIDAKLVEKVI